MMMWERRRSEQWKIMWYSFPLASLLGCSVLSQEFVFAVEKQGLPEPRLTMAPYSMLQLGKHMDVLSQNSSCSRWLLLLIRRGCRCTGL